MGLGTSIFLIAVGAILKWGVNAPSENFNVSTIGVILMVVGAVGGVLSLAFWNSWGGAGFGRRSTTVTEDGAGRRKTLREETFQERERL